MINMKTLSSSRAPSPSYEPLASSSYIDFEGEDDRDAPLLQSSRSSGDGRRGAGQAGRWNVMLLLGFALLLLIGLTWSSGAAYDWQAGRGTVELSTAVVVEDGADGGSIAKEQIEGEEQARTDEEEPLEPPKTADPTIATDQEQEELDAVLAGQDGVEDDGVEDDAGVLDDLDDDSSTALDSTEDDTDAESSPSPLIPILNVRPHPRPPPSDPAVADQIRYLSYENHSGFHNQRKSLTNALLVAHILKRTLLLPPARLGSTAPWEPTLESVVPFMERCKAGISLPTDDLCSTSAHSDGNRWTYVGWSYLVSEKLLDGRQLVDRWNSSMEWMYESLEVGGLGLHEEDVVRFEDPVRRSYQFYDDRLQKTQLGQFAQRIDLEDLMVGKMAEARLLHFGSMFGGGRMKVSRAENLAEQQKLESSMIFNIEKVDGISDAIRDALGSYVGVHLRVGDGIFKTKAHENMQGVFRRLCKNVFKLKRRQIDALLQDSATRPPPRPVAHLRRRHALPRLSWALTDDIEDPLDSQVASPHQRRALERDTPRPLSPSLRCRSALHTDPALRTLNTPLYIATDSRSPLTDRNIAPFFHHFPCAFLVTDFASTASGVNQRPIPDLVEMVEGKWTSDWDGQGLANYLYPFLEAEVAAKGIDVVGTPQSTFSGYTAGTLHAAYRQQGKTTEQVSGVAARDEQRQDNRT